MKRIDLLCLVLVILAVCRAIVPDTKADETHRLILEKNMENPTPISGEVVREWKTPEIKQSLVLPSPDFDEAIQWVREQEKDNPRKTFLFQVLTSGTLKVTGTEYVISTALEPIVTKTETGWRITFKPKP